MYKYSKHRKYKQNIEPRKYYAQCHKMEEYLASPYVKEGSIYWVGMNESCYNEYLQEQNKLYEGLITTYPFAYECTKEAYLGDMCVYHLTNDYYIEKTLKNGLVPKTKNKIENHPDRVYVAKEKNISKKFIRQMFLYMKNYKFKPIKYIYLLKIDLSKCEDKRFFLDPSAPDGMFTYENIPPQCISIEKEIDVNKL